MMDDAGKADGMNLTKRLSTAGIASRRKAAELIKDGKVTVNGKVETNPATVVGPADQIRVEGSSVAGTEEHVYIMLNKPRGYVCTNDDPHAKKKALDLIQLRHPVRLFSAGRLDKDSEGLIIFTNDGDFAARLTHPRNGIVKTYALSAEHPFTDEELQQMVDGVEHDGETLSAEEVWQTGKRKYMILLAEGKNREIRRIVEALGNRTKRLERMAIGDLRRGMLKPGQWRFMTRRDIARILMLEEDDPQLDIYPVRRRPSLPRRSGAAEAGNHSATRRFPPSRRNGKRNERDGQDFSPRRDRAERPNRRRSHFDDDGRFE